MSLTEMKRLFSEWRIRLARAKDVLQPPVWSAEEWNEFALTLTGVVRKYGRHWEEGETQFFDLRWELIEGGELACQFEDTEGGKRSLVVAQYGGFADGTENYIWFYGEFNDHGTFIGNPYYVNGSWKDALSIILMPHKASSQFYLTDAGAPIEQGNLLGAGPTSGQYWESAADVPQAVHVEQAYQAA
ncbi:MAG: hypothetical protein AAFY98_04830 [Verrucomicrobiota bacterium]